MSLFQFAYYLWSDALNQMAVDLMPPVSVLRTQSHYLCCPDYGAAFMITEVYDMIPTPSGKS